MASKRQSAWQEYALEEIAKLIGGGTPKRGVDSYFGTDLDWVTPTDLAPIGVVEKLGPVKQGITEEGLNKSSAKRIPSGSVLFSSRASIGKIAVTDRECATNQGFANFVPIEEKVDTWFLAYLLCSAIPEITQLAGKTTFKEVSRTKLKNFKVRIPSLEEQRRIVARIQECLSRVEEMERLQAEVAEDATHVTGRFLYQEFSSIAEGSPSVLIDDVTKDSRYGTNNKCSEEPSGTPILRIPNVANGYVNTENLKYCSLGEKEYQKVGLQPGDLLVVRTNGSPDLVGRCAVFREDSQFGFASYLIRFRLDQAKVLPEYLSFFLQSPGGRTAIAGIRKTSAGQFNVNSENLRGISFPLPDLDTQERLIERAKQVQMMSGEMAEDYSRDTAALRNAILRQAFAGEL